MKNVKIKLCGLTSEAAVECAVSLGVDYMGFILADGFRRTVAPDDVKRWCAEAKSSNSNEERIFPKRVGVFVNDDIKKVVELLESGVIDIAQLHGNEEDEYIRQLKEKTDKTVFKAFSVKTMSDVENALASPADMVLLDSGTGTGKRFDTELISDFGRDYILAGGLDPENVAQAIRELEPFGVDVSSGIETDGVKDIEKMKRFVEEARGVLL
ncbi:MAG: phosphoribosylanthranilate isomerase [Eubacterium sp.]|nr:phosphoribosylanthranilate isomerase [Eubacterium sp.]